MIALTISCHISTEFAFVIPKILSLAAYLLYSILSHWQVWNQYTQYFSRIKNISRYFNLVNGKSLNDTLKMQKNKTKRIHPESNCPRCLWDFDKADTSLALRFS